MFFVIFIIIIIAAIAISGWLFKGSYDTQKQIDEKRMKHYDTEKMVEKSYKSHRGLWK